ncbi:SPFH domain-containing protein [Sulfuriroseicoccus oceanibius]|uniref:SPFH/Band 7/PHB domain protein n=1 Tax=Sulfuriroseicoccus oceanibius TaxID=2707525 RepID=A0A6B3LE07_9BACT|nr:SPFH domain-containing protein [Sulfuriroseicoccus oceanibius]QQL45913.1 SPFH/Band 7/PHB domain protein [Sulfuriroseicoccus oceanibius]
MAYFIIGFLLALIGIPLVYRFGGMLQLWRVIPEKTVLVYTLFGKVIGELDEAGINFPFTRFGPKAFLVPFFGKVYKVSTNIHQYYLRNQLVNSEEGAPMGVGIWYECYVSNPKAYLFENSEPVRSLSANVSTAVIKQLSNLKLDVLLEDRDALSRMVRSEVSPKSQQWGFTLGSTYIRKVAFRDQGMIKEIERKVVNRLRQVTASMRQDGENRVAIIRSNAEKEASRRLGKAQAVRPQIVGEALSEIRENPEVAEVLFDLLDLQATLKSEGKIILNTGDQHGGPGMLVNV